MRLQELLLFLVVDVLEEGGSYPRAKFQRIGDCQKVNNHPVHLPSNDECFTMTCSLSIRKAKALKEARESRES